MCLILAEEYWRCGYSSVVALAVSSRMVCSLAENTFRRFFVFCVFFRGECMSRALDTIFRTREPQMGIRAL